jgi:uncharacterized protein YicC (UPF0701 family)
MDKRVLGQRLEELFEDLRDEGRELSDTELAEEIASMVTKLDMEELFDVEVEDEDDLDQGD